MAFDIDMIKKVYANMTERVDAARDIVGKPLTLSEPLKKLRRISLTQFVGFVGILRSS